MVGLSSLHVCMDSSDWFQGTTQEEAAMMDSSSSSPLAISGDILTSRVPLMDNQRRLLRPQHEQAQKCPRCDSTHTKFCYYNNYSLSQPRYFCKACRRYWTKGGTLRNIPVGGGCRKNKKVSSRKPNDQNHPGRSSSSSLSSPVTMPGLISNNPTHLQLSFPDDGEFQQLNNSIMSHHGHNFGHLNFIDPTKYNNNNSNNNSITSMHGNNFIENKYGLSLLGNGEMGILNGGVVNDMHYCQGLSQFGMPSSFEVNNVSLVDNGYHQRLMLPYHQTGHQENGTIDVKPNPKLLTLNWHDQACPPPDNHHAASGGQEDNTIAYLGGLESSWLMNHGYGS